MNRITNFCVIGLIAFSIIVQTAQADDDKSELKRLFDNFKTAYVDEQYATARDWANQVVDAKVTKYGSGSPELIVSLVNLGGVEIELQDWTAAEKTMTRGLKILDAQAEDNFDQRMVLMLNRAKAEFGLRDASAAKKTLFEASRINNSQAAKDLWYEAEIYLELVETARRDPDQSAGNRYTKKSLGAREAYFGDEKINLLPYLDEAANWYRYSSQFGRERQVNNRAIELIENEYGPNDARLAQPLRRNAASYTFARKSPAKAEQALMRAASLDFPDAAGAIFERARIQADLGDYQIVFADPDDSRKYYSAAWALMADHSELGQNFANDFFSEQRQLYFPMPRQPANSGKGANFMTDGHVKMSFTVTENGTLMDFEVTEKRPLEMKNRLFESAAKKARYRPRVFNGTPVKTEQVTWLMTYDLTIR